MSVRFILAMSKSSLTAVSHLHGLKVLHIVSSHFSPQGLRRSRIVRNVEVGDIVVMADNNAVHGKWTISSVNEVHPVTDG